MLPNWKISHDLAPHQTPTTTPQKKRKMKNHPRNISFPEQVQKKIYKWKKKELIELNYVRTF